MADFSEFVPTTPASLARIFSEDLVRTGALDNFALSQREECTLVELDTLAEQMGFLDTTYFVDAGRSILVPKSFAANEPLSVTHFAGLSFSGELKTHSTVRLNSIVGANAIRALCLTFGNVTLLPFCDKIPDDQLLHVPVLAVSDMQPISQAS